MPKKPNVCSVSGCKNSYRTTQGSEPPVHFYKFPFRSWETERRKKWIIFMKRKNLDGSPWAPTKYSTVCSQHFVGHAKSEDSSSPSYSPTIFNVTQRHGESGRIARYNRAKRRRTACQLKDKNEGLQQINFPHLAKNAETENERACQTDDVIGAGNYRLIECYSSTSNGTASTFIRHTYEVDDGTITDSKQFVSRCVGSSMRSVVFTGYKNIQSDEEALKKLTSVNAKTFHFLLSLLPELAEIRNHSLFISIEDKLLLFLFKIKHGLTFASLSVIFNVDQSTASRIFLTVLEVLVAKTKNLIFWPSRHIISKKLPTSFKRDFANCRAIIHCTEIKCQRPNEMFKQNLMWSDHNGTFTIKFLVAISPDGLITFISKCYGGHATDSYIINNSGFLQKLEPGDLIMSDKGYPHIKESLGEADTFLVVSPFVRKGEMQFSESEMTETYKIASVRIHVEHVIQRIEMHNILNVRFSKSLFPYVDDIVHMCCVLTNFQLFIIKNES